MTLTLRSFSWLLGAAATSLAGASAFPTELAAQEPVVNAVLFYSPTCPHCHEVINRHLPPLRERYGDRLAIVGVDVTTPSGSALYDAAAEYYGLAPDRLGVPLMVIGDVTLLGSLEIPEQLPALIDRGLAAGGTAWPTLPPLREALMAQGLIPQDPTPEATPAAPTGDETLAPPADTATANPTAPPFDVAPRAEEEPSVTPPTPDAGPLTTALTPAATTVPLLRPSQRFLQDPLGNSVAVAVFVSLLGTLMMALLALRPGARLLPSFPTWVAPVLATAGLGVALYLTLVEVTGVRAVCGPVGDCNAVQQSEYARLFGVLPVGLLGALGYLGILGGWSVAQYGPENARAGARRFVWWAAFAGTAFSAYLTFLEPFFIGATCAWCVSSALILAVLLLTATRELRPAP